MASVRARKETGKLFFDFRWQGRRCREQTELENSAANRRRLESVMDRIEFEIGQGTFEYTRYFPNSPLATAAPAQLVARPTSVGASAPEVLSTPTFDAFCDTWFEENAVRWRRSTRQMRLEMLRTHLRPKFGAKKIATISRADVLSFRSEFAQRPGKQSGTLVSPKTVNDVIGVLKNILDEAADRFGHTSPAIRIQRLRVPRKDICPFSLDEVWTLTSTCRADYRPYLTVRFLTGMRTGEANGLKWNNVDFERRQILIRETFAKGAQDGTKTDGSMREIDMSQHVFDALKVQYAMTGKLNGYVFCSRQGLPIDLANFTHRVWNPLLRMLKLSVRRPYQMRHTAATLWLAAGENPEWIARQLGHSTTEMLFRVYSRFVPNLTRRDGSAFERMLAANRTDKESGE